jgi:hypothetical protein
MIWSKDKECKNRRSGRSHLFPTSNIQPECEKKLRFKRKSVLKEKYRSCHKIKSVNINSGKNTDLIEFT